MSKFAEKIARSDADKKGTGKRAEQKTTVGNNGYNSLRRNFLPKIPRFFTIFRLRRKESCGFFRNEIIAETVSTNLKMNIVRYITFGFLILFFSCSEHCVTKYEIVDKKHEIGFYKWQNKASIEKGESQTDRYERIDLDQNDIDFADKVLLNTKQNKSDSESRIYRELCEYNMQLGGIFDNKTNTKLIYINFFCGDFDFFNEKDDGESNRFLDVRDGGDCFFQGVIDTKTSEFKILIINGEA